MSSKSLFTDLFRVSAPDALPPATPGTEFTPTETLTPAEPGEPETAESEETEAYLESTDAVTTESKEPEAYLESTDAVTTESEEPETTYEPTPAEATSIDATTPVETPPPPPPPLRSETAGLDQVRDLLFGDQCSRIDHIEVAQSETVGLIARIQESTQELRAAVDGLTARLDTQSGLITEISCRIGTRVDSIDERLTAGECELRDEFIGHKTALVGLVQERTEELFQLVHEELRRIRGADSERAAIATLLHDVAGCFEASDE